MERKMAFYEIGRGQLEVDIQQKFEEAQEISAQREVDVKIKLEIIVHKPDPSDEDFIRAVSYTHSLVQPPERSLKHRAVQKNDVIIKNAEESPEQTSILDLEIPEPGILSLNKKQA